ncbi:hypothetical protein O9992_04860 [Vibrio lentus]|nr:hypothetical protein [Vibrio lentus]
MTAIGGGNDSANISWVGEHELTYGLDGYKAEQWTDASDGVAKRFQSSEPETKSTVWIALI